MVRGWEGGDGSEGQFGGLYLPRYDQKGLVSVAYQICHTGV